jgi:putative transcriptional regulator
MTHASKLTIPATPGTSANVFCPEEGLASAQRRGTPDEKPSPAWFLAVLFLAVGLLAGAASTPCWSQQKPESKLLYLVARPSILDPLFAKSVVLMLPLTGEPLVVGLILNKPTQIPLAKLFPGNRLLKERTDTAYVGGPIEPDVAALVFHSPRPFDQALLLYDDVYVTFDLKFITARLKDPKQTGDVRLFLGRAQWDPKQLQDEAFDGSWYSLRAEGQVIFEGDSAKLWQRMHSRARPPSNVQNLMPRLPFERQFPRISIGFLSYSLPVFPTAGFIARTKPSHQ